MRLKAKSVYDLEIMSFNCIWDKNKTKDRQIMTGVQVVYYSQRLYYEKVDDNDIVDGEQQASSSTYAQPADFSAVILSTKLLMIHNL